MYIHWEKVYRAFNMKNVFLLGVLLALVSCSNCQSSTLIMNVIEQTRPENATFVCTMSPSTNSTRWTYLAGSTGTSLLSFQNGICTVSPSDSFLSNSGYSYTCNKTVYQVTAYTSPISSMNNHIVVCRDALQPDSRGTTWITKIITESCIYCGPTMTFYVKEITEGESIAFVCIVSSGENYVNWNTMNVGSKAVSMSVDDNDGQCTTSTGTTFLDNTSEYVYTCNNTVYQVTRLNVKRSEHNDIYMCTPFSWAEGKGSNWIIKVKAPVTSVTMLPEYSVVNVIENTAVKLTCITSTARPTASVYWYRHSNGNSNTRTQITQNITTTTDFNDLSVTSSVLWFIPTRQHNNTTISCESNNSVNTSPVKSSMTKLLNVKYKADNPYIIQGREYLGIENTPGTLSCSVKGGNPKPTIFWSCSYFSPTTQSTVDSDGNVTTTFTWTALRNHTGTCTCTSQQKNVFQNESIDVSLVVLYKASVTSFTIEGFMSDDVTVNESVSFRFICYADSKPTAEMILRYGSTTLKSVISNSLEHYMPSASCLDAGNYYCSAKNMYNEDSSVHTVQLFVNCYPRAAYMIDTNTTSERNNTITFTFNTIAYPPPTFTWYQFVGENWILLNNDNNFKINTSNLQSNLTIYSVGMDDFTNYKVIVKNDYGEVNHVYNLLPYGKPDPPIWFRHIEGRTTPSSIHLEWKPGSDNGPSQTFYIKYKKSSDTMWKYLRVPDNGEDIMELSLTELTENTQYGIVMLATNELGNSSESSVLIITTKAIDKPNLIPLIGGIAGGVTGCIILVIVIIVLIRRYPVFKRSGADKQGVRRSISVDLDNEDGSRADMQDVRRSSSVDTDNEDGLVDNPLYESSKPSAIYAKPLKPNKPNATGTGDVLYAEVKKTNKKEPKKKRQPQSGKGKQKEVDVYENVAPDNIPVKKGVTKHPYPEKPITKESKIGNNKGLIYADLEFNDKQPGKKMVIKGDDSTTYDLVDFTKKAKPLPESDGDDEK